MRFIALRYRSGAGTGKIAEGLSEQVVEILETRFEPNQVSNG